MPSSPDHRTSSHASKALSTAVDQLQRCEPFKALAEMGVATAWTHDGGAHIEVARTPLCVARRFSRGNAAGCVRVRALNMLVRACASACVCNVCVRYKRPLLVSPPCTQLLRVQVPRHKLRRLEAVLIRAAASCNPFCICLTDLSVGTPGSRNVDILF